MKFTNLIKAFAVCINYYAFITGAIILVRVQHYST